MRWNPKDDRARMRPIENDRFSNILPFVFELNQPEYVNLELNEWLGRNYIENHNENYPTMAIIQNGIISFTKNRLEYIYQNVITQKELKELIYNH